MGFFKITLPDLPSFLYVHKGTGLSNVVAMSNDFAKEYGLEIMGAVPHEENNGFSLVVTYKNPKYQKTVSFPYVDREEI